MEPTPEQIQTRYANLLTKAMWQKNKAIIGGILLLVGVSIAILIPILNAIYNLDIFPAKIEETDLSTRIKNIIIAGALLSIMIGGLALIGKGEKKIFDKQQKIFFEFYHTYVILKNFLDLKENQREAVQRIDKLIYYIENWTDSRSPDPIHYLPNSIKNNLTEKVHRLVKSGKFSELHDFTEYVHGFAYKVYDNQPTESQLLEFNGFLNEMPEVPEIKPAKIVEPFEKRSFVFPLFASVIPSIILYVILSKSELQWGAIVLGVIGIGAVIFFSLFRIKRG